MPSDEIVASGNSRRVSPSFQFHGAALLNSKLGLSGGGQRS